MISVTNVKKKSIRGHYNLATPFYRLFWGPHIHHGLWIDEAVTPYEAQCKLTDKLADLARIEAGNHVLDVGCGMGGSSIRLASNLRCRCSGITLSPVQRRWAASSAFLHGLSRRATFQSGDIEEVDFPRESFDVIWSVECTEHLYDKASFFQRAASWLKPGGKIAIVVWFQGRNPQTEGHQQRVEDLCRRFVCPSFATVDEYSQWMTQAGFTSVQHYDWSEHAAKTWMICKERVRKSGVSYLARLISQEQVDFLGGFDKLIAAFETGDMEYGALVAQRQ
jgi:tocopherol O-methyltransferase